MIDVVEICGDEYKCICPLHEDDKPSLYINLKKNAAICFAGCYQGNIINLVAKVEKISKVVAWRKVATGEIFNFLSNHEYSKRELNKPFINGDIRWVCGDFHPYLKNRGFSRSTIRMWDIEYSPDIRHIRIPVFSSDGELLCYSYRAIDNNVEPKYLHPGFSKRGGWLFGVRMFEKHNGLVNLTEGPLDCIWLWQHGFTNTLAFLGTPAKTQIENIFNYGYRFRLCLDNDTAGRNAKEKIGCIIKDKGKDFWSIQIPEGKKDVQDLNSEEILNIMLGNKEE